jgi:hypothetical protein
VRRLAARVREQSMLGWVLENWANSVFGSNGQGEWEFRGGSSLGE